jgi:hypothetical protein
MQLHAAVAELEPRSPSIELKTYRRDIFLSREDYISKHNIKKK